METYITQYRILSTIEQLKAPSEAISNFCAFMWREFLFDAPDKADAIISVVPCSDRDECYSIYHDDRIAVDYGRELRHEKHFEITKVLENIVLGFSIIRASMSSLIAPFHSGAVGKDGKGALIVGKENAGKSTLTLELISNHGCSYFSDEVGLFDANDTMRPFPKTISCTSGIIRHDANWISKQFEKEHHVAVPKERHGKRADLKVIIFVQYRKDIVPELRPMRRGDALVRLLNSQIGMSSSYGTVERVAGIVNAAESYEIRHNDAGKAAQMVANLL